MIAEYPALLKTELSRAHTSVNPVGKGELRHSGFFVPGKRRWATNLEQQVQSPRSETEEEADRRDMRRLIAGQEEALQSLMERHAETLHSQLTHILRNRLEVQEALQETFLRVYLHRDHFDFKHKLSTWMYAIALNLARDQLRRRARQPEFISLEDPEECENLAEKLLDPEEPADTQLQDAERSLSLARAVEALPEKLRQPLILSVFDRKSQMEIAAELHCTVKAVETRLYHARKQLHRALEKEFNNGNG